MHRSRFVATSFAVGLAALFALAAFLPADWTQARDGVQAECQVGNPVEIGQPPVPELFFGNQEWAYLIYPPDQCDCPEGGFQLDRVNMDLSLNPGQVPVIFSASAFLREAIYNAETGCYVPGEVLYFSPPVTFTFDEPGVYTITVPTPETSCEVFDEHYFIGLRYLEPFLADLAIDEQPAPCTAYVDSGNGWFDFYDLRKSSTGKPIIWGDIVCCDINVPAEDGTWTEIKGLYR
jgi:hypothetical protein